jgi:hypothetical protein
VAQRSSTLDEHQHVDGLVAHTHLRVVGECPRQPVCDLFG